MSRLPVRVRTSVSVSARRVYAACFFFVALLMLTGSVAAAPASVTGTVSDPQGKLVPGVQVVLRSAVGVTREVTTDAGGRFVFEQVSNGHYDLTVTLDGFRAQVARITVGAEPPAPLAMTLQLSAVSESVVVSSSLVDTPLSESPAGTVVVSGRDMQARQFTTIADALRMTPGGAQVTTGGTGAQVSFFARGGESDYTLVLVDGVKLNSFGGGFDFGHLMAGGVSSVEVVRGPQSAVYGADAIGGVIQVRTAIGGPLAASATVETGGYGTTHVVAGTTGSSGPLQWGAHYDTVTSDGWTDKAPGRTFDVTNDDYTAHTAALAFAWKPRAGTTVRFDGRHGRNERGHPGPFGSDPAGLFYSIDTDSRTTNTLGLGSLSVTHEINPQTAVRIRSSYMQLDSDYASAWGDSMAKTHRWSVHGQVDRALSSNVSATVGVDSDGERAESTYIQNGSFAGIPVKRQVTGYFAEARVRGGSQFLLTTGFRLEQIVRKALEGDGGTRPDMPADTVWSPNPRVTASYYLRTSATSGGNWSRLHASAGTGIRSADAFELAFTDNPGLKPERSRSVDAGLEQSVLGGLIVLDATAFFNSYDDLIVSVGGGLAMSSRYQTDNIANARARGAEFSAAWRTRWGLEARGTYTFLDSEVLALDDADGLAQAPFSVGEPLLRRPKHQFSADLLLSRTHWSAFVRAAGRNHVLDVEPNWGASYGLYNADGFAVIDVGGSIGLGRFGSLYARVANVLDREYEGALGYPAPRRTVVVGVRLAASR